MRLICFCFLLVLLGIPASHAQTAQGVPLTLESFRNLTPQEGARLLIGPSAEQVSKMIVASPPSSYPFRVRLFLRPKAVRPGLCMQDEVDVVLSPADGSSLSGFNASTVMKIANINFTHEYAAVGDLAGEFTPDQRTDVEAKCGALAGPAAFIAASSTDEAWESVYLADLAIKQAAANGPERTTIDCHLGPACDHAYDRLTKLSAANVGPGRRSCGEPAPIRSDVCYWVALRDEGVLWAVYIEASRDSAAGFDPKLNLKSARFTVSSLPTVTFR